MGARWRLAQLVERTLGEVAVAVLAHFAPSASAPPDDAASIFVLRNNDLGDLLVVTPLFEALRRRFPESWIVAGVGRWGFPILSGNPHLSEVMAIDAPWFNKFTEAQGVLRQAGYITSSPQALALKDRRFEVGIDVVGSVWGTLLLLRAGFPHRLGVAGYARGGKGLTRTVPFDAHEHVGRTALRFAGLLGASELPACRPQIFLSEAEKAAGQHAWEGLFGEGSNHATRVVLAPGSGLSVKSWPEDHYRTLAVALSRQENLRLAVVGGPGEWELGAAIAASEPRIGNLSGQLSLRETFALVAACDLVVANSSMLMHAAAAFHRPTVVLLGESFPSARQHDAQWGYPGTCRSLGKEPGERQEIFSPVEAQEVILEIVSGSLPGRRPLS